MIRLGPHPLTASVDFSILPAKADGSRVLIVSLFLFHFTFRIGGSRE